jgi:hypothetical protein
MPNETPEQRQARLDAANLFHARLMARERAAEEARMPTPEPMPMRTPVMPQLGRSLGSFLSPQQQGMTKSPFIDQSFPDGAVRADGPGTVPPWARFGFTGDQPMLTQPGTGYDEVVMPVQPQGGLTLAAQPAAPAFDINNAMNTFNQQLGQRVTSGQMTLDQARAAQAEMTALQRSPNATREQATDIAQRQMQVGQYAPQPQGLVMNAPPQGMAMGGMMRGSTAEDRGPTTEGQRDAAYFRMQGLNAMVAPQGATPDYTRALLDQMSNAVGQNRGVALTEYNATPVSRGSAKQMLNTPEPEQGIAIMPMQETPMPVPPMPPTLMPVPPMPVPPYRPAPDMDIVVAPQPPTGMALGGLMRKYY